MRLATIQSRLTSGNRKRGVHCEAVVSDEEATWLQSVSVEIVLQDHPLEQIQHVLLVEGLVSIQEHLHADKSTLEGGFSPGFVLAQLARLSKAIQQKTSSSSSGPLTSILDEVHQKLVERLKDPLYVQQDGLLSQIECLLQTLRSNEVFHLELCAPVHDETDRQLSQFEKYCVDYSQTWCLESEGLERQTGGAATLGLSLPAWRMRCLRELIETFPCTLKANEEG